jgi:hypothetical protein
MEVELQRESDLIKVCEWNEREILWKLIGDVPEKCRNCEKDIVFLVVFQAVLGGFFFASRSDWATPVRHAPGRDHPTPGRTRDAINWSSLLKQPRKSFLRRSYNLCKKTSIQPTLFTFFALVLHLSFPRNFRVVGFIITPLLLPHRLHPNSHTDQKGHLEVSFVFKNWISPETASFQWVSARIPEIFACVAHKSMENDQFTVDFLLESDQFQFGAQIFRCTIQKLVENN